MSLDQTAFFTLSYGLYVLTSAYGDKRGGCIVNTLCQVTAVPEQLSVTVNKDNQTAELISRSGVFAATALTEDADMDLIARFGFKRGREFDKFSLGDERLDENGVPYVPRSAAALFSCEVIDSKDVGTHIIFVGRVVDARKLSEGTPMTYTYYHTVKRGVTPPNAPSFKKPEPKSERAAWRCAICGHVHEEEGFPEGFQCPVCGQSAAAFERIHH